MGIMGNGTSNGDGAFIREVKSHWFILVALFGLATAYGVNTTRLAQAIEDAGDNEARIASVEKNIADLKRDMAVVSTHQSHILSDIEEMQMTLEAILTELRSRPPGD